jgi:hypothetical protein
MAKTWRPSSPMCSERSRDRYSGIHVFRTGKVKDERIVVGPEHLNT